MRGVRANRTKRMRTKLIQRIKEQGPQSSRELLDYYNRATKQGSTMNSITNVLAKDPRFEVVNTIRVSGATGTVRLRGSQYDMLVWGLSPQGRKEDE